MMQHHERLSSKETRYGKPNGPDTVVLMTFDLLLVPVTQEHGVDVVGKVGRGEKDVDVGQPVPEEKS